MTLPIGTKIGPYEVTASLGAGGMGEVFRARDTRLDRDVALKILPAEFSSDPERLARFEREAKTLAALNHSNIAAIHGIEDARRDDGTHVSRALIMELVDGEDLSQRLARGPISVEEALPIARQIAMALEAAHEQGIIHRDLKPANVKVRPDGTVKVLDFGLAKADVHASGANVLNSPTITSPMTMQGTILGTAAYMAPEQARGQAVDRRADIWAFGCVLFEMLTGRRPFDGPTVTDVLAAVVKSEPDWGSLPADTPASVQRLLRRCLTRDRSERLQHMGDARLDLTASPQPESIRAASPTPARSRRLVMLSGWVAALVATAVAVWAYVGRDVAPVTRAAYRFSIPQLAAGAATPIVSPDGRHLAYAASSRIWVRSFDGVDRRPLDGTDGARSPFWSPDSRHIGFFAGELLKRVALTGGLPDTLATVPQGWPAASWSSKGSILIEVTESPGNEGWYVLQPGTSSLKKLRAFSDNRPINPDKAFPEFLPDGVHFLFTHPVDTTATLQIGSIASESTTALVQAETRASYASGFVFYVRGGALFAQPFDPDARALTGDPVQIVENIDYFTPTGEASFSVSQEGTLVFRRFEPRSHLQWFARDGRQVGTVAEPNYYSAPAIARDGQRLAVEILDPRRSTADLWVIDLERNIPTRLTSSPRSELNPQWSPDGAQLAFSADWEGPPNLYVIAAAGGEPRILVPFDRTVQDPDGWSPDGSEVLYTKRTDSLDIWAVAVATGERRRILGTTFNEGSPKVSPDGRWLAYVSNASGRGEVYVRPFPDGTSQVRLSTNGGRLPDWRADGHELFYVEPSGDVMAVSFAPGASGAARPGLPTRLFQVDARLLRAFDVAPDGQRFLLHLADHTTLTHPDEVVVDWMRLLRKENPK